MIQTFLGVNLTPRQVFPTDGFEKRIFSTTLSKTTEK